MDLKYLLFFLLIFYIMTINNKNIFYGAFILISAYTFYIAKNNNINNLNIIAVITILLAIFSFSIFKRKTEHFKNNNNIIDPKNAEKININNDNIINTNINKFKTLTKPITLNNLTELNYIFKTLLGYNNDKTRSILIKYDINSKYDLATIINTSSNTTFFDKKDNESPNDFDSWIKNKKIKSFSELVYVYNLDVDDICASLINDKDIFSLKDLYTQVNVIYGYDSLVKLSVDYYKGDKVLTDKHYEIGYALNLFDNLKIDKINTIETILNSKIYKTQEINDIVSILIWFEYLEFIPPVDLNTKLNKKTKDDYTWVIKTLKNINLNDNIFITNDLFKSYKISNKIQQFLKMIQDKKTKEMIENKIDFSEPEAVKINPFDEAKEIQHKNIMDKSYKIIKEGNINANKDIVTDIRKEFLNIDTFKTRLSNVFVDIIDEMFLLIQNYNIENKNNNENYINSFLRKYLYYFSGLFQIISQKQRMLYVGVIILLLAIIINFIEISS
jgi:hypothetical protein